ncbi:fasciclin domain-containing protein [Streptomyces sp. DT24]|uniref:fasciclin domain-containing protein n=1 Tax=unclassified Streptomyces TaxID=2593676 RepID=UPI0023B9533D|nr:fasciclin domain-containing protein [Streptomyces sp. AM 4-1-1]WEH35278.1 fasciclin domain-containing protein [Streptomyces sp. AM 4-1-1]
MQSPRFRTTALAVAAAVALPVTLGTLAPTAFADTASPSPSTSASASASSSASMAPDDSKPFGPGCSALPKSGRGSVSEMAKEPVATALAHNPELSTLNKAVMKAGLSDTLDKAKDSTLFAPTDKAFDKLGKAQVDKLLKDTARLKKIISYHWVKEDVKPSQLHDGSFKTDEGGSLTTSGSGTSFKVNDKAKIDCGNLKTSNAKVYTVDEVLMPSS